jgi:aquaporin NIP
MMMKPNRFIAEMIGTFALVFAGPGAVVVDGVSGGAVTHVGVAITFGLVVMAVIYAIGDVSGAHLNPAVTLGFWVSRRLPARDVLPYIAAQVTGAVAAGGLLRGLFGDQAALAVTLPAGPAVQSLVLEAVLTAGLMFVILCVATGPKEVGVMAGIAIGGVIGLEAMFAGPICGASMNPARSFGPALVTGQFQHLWLYLVGPIAGAIVAVPLWRFTRGSGLSLPSTSPEKSSP